MHRVTLPALAILLLLLFSLAPGALLAQDNADDNATADEGADGDAGDAMTTDDADDADAGDDGEADEEAPSDDEAAEAAAADLDSDEDGDFWSQFKPYVELRLKPEWRTNNNAGQENDFNTFLRARLGLIWTPEDSVSVTIILQDVHKFEVASSGGGTVGGGGTTSLTFNADLYLGFIQWEVFDGLNLLGGRQEISYDDQRMLGALNWVDAGRQFDAFRARLGNKAHGYDEFSLDLFWTPLRFVNSGPLATGGPVPTRFAKHTRQLAGLHATLPFIADHKLSAYILYLNNRAAAGVPDHTFTIGAFFKSTAKEGFVYDAEIAIQINKTNAVDDLGFAWAEHVGVGFIAGDLTIAAEANAASGDDGGTTRESFNNLFPTNHNKYGYIDRQNWSNTLNFAVRAWYKLSLDEDSAPWIAEVSVWVFFPLRYSGANDNFAPGGTFATGARGMKAFEVDLLVKHKFTDVLTAAFGASIWAPGAALRVSGVKGTDIYLYSLVGVKF